MGRRRIYEETYSGSPRAQSEDILPSLCVAIVVNTQIEILIIHGTIHPHLNVRELPQQRSILPFPLTNTSVRIDLSTDPRNRPTFQPLPRIRL